MGGTVREVCDIDSIWIFLVEIMEGGRSVG